MMIKHGFLVGALMALAACSVPDENYYRVHPQALQQAMKDCYALQSNKLKCEKLSIIASNINQLAFQLQADPQNFGKKIVALQETLAKQQINLQENPNQPALKGMIDKNKQELMERLAVVKWLESPES